MDTSKRIDFSRFDLPQLTEDSYGFRWGEGHSGQQVSQVTKDLCGFRFNGSVEGFNSRFWHGLKLVQMIWPGQVELFKKWRHFQSGDEVVIWNTDFIRIFKALCESKRVALTGSSSSGKTFAVAVYAMLMFMCDPENTTVMVSTTAGSDAERRVWAEIRDLHRMADSVFPVGTLIDYIKCITFDPGRELLKSRSVMERDIRNGIMLIPIPRGQEGENALGKIIGTKNKNVIWIIDELPHMIDDILRPESNLEANLFFQLVGIGNANRKTDPHGRMCEPAGGYDTITVDDDEWEGVAGTRVVFCHGKRTGNFHPAVDQSSDDRQAYPFPFLSSPPYVRRVAELNGHGNPALGEKTIDFMRFAIGFWYGSDVPETILSAEMCREHKAVESGVQWGSLGTTIVAGFDCGFSAGGDANELTFLKIGKGHDGRSWAEAPAESIRISGIVSDRESFRKAVAKQVVAECRRAGVKPGDFGMDINADGGLMMQEIQREWQTHEVVGLSSLEKADDEKYFHRVTQYWFQAAELVCSGRMRGFNPKSRYARDLFERKYESAGRGVVRVEKKTDMRARIKRSPDAGDSFCYAAHMAIRAGFELRDSGPQERDVGGVVDDLRRRLGGDWQSGEDSEQFSSSEEAEELALF